jgi:hypothetical protein
LNQPVMQMLLQHVPHDKSPDKRISGKFIARQ